MSYVDTHAHLDAAAFDHDRNAVIHRAHCAGVRQMVCPGITADSSREVVRLAETSPAVFAAVGIQPNHCAEAEPGDWDRVVALAGHPRVVALGETGLDRHWDFTPLDLQRDYFDRHLRLAQSVSLPIVIHCREAEPEVLAMLGEAAARGPLVGVVHAFSGDASFARACLEWGLLVSFAGAVTYTNRKFRPLWEAAAEIPADRLLLETDSPYLTPHPLRGKVKRNEPSHVLHTARRLAELRGCRLEEIACQTTSNAQRLFRLPPPE